MEKLIFILFLAYLGFLIYEKKRAVRERKSFKYVIHINGIRGKSTVSRLIEAGLRAGGYKTFAKITGTSPRVINASGEEKEIYRKGKANIKEQIETIHWAYKEKAEILILECMAVKPEFQHICETEIIHSDIGVITNVREDHLDEMGETLDEIAASLSNTIPEKGAIFTGDEKYFEFFNSIAAEKKSQAFLSNDKKSEYEEIDFPENVALALEVCKYVGVSEKIALEGMHNYHRDPGRLKTVKYNNKKAEIYFVNALAANDPDSTGIILNEIKKKYYWENKKYLLINNRGDRVSRWQQYVKFVLKVENLFDGIIIFGENRELFKKYLLKNKISKDRIITTQDKEFVEDIKDDSIIFAAGNICGYGRQLVDYLQNRGEIVND